MTISNPRIERKNLTDIVIKWEQDIDTDVTISVDGTKISINGSQSFAGKFGENSVTILNIPSAQNICVDEIPICYRGFKIYPPNTTPAPYPSYNPLYYVFYTNFANWQARTTENEIKKLVNDYIAYGWQVTQC